MADQSFDSMFAAASGSAAPTSPTSPSTPAAPPLSVTGENLPPQTGTAGPMSPEAEQTSAAAANGGAAGSTPSSFDSMFSQATGQPDPGQSGQPPYQGGFFKGYGEGSGLGGVPALVKGVAQKDMADTQRALDIWHEMMAHHQAGDSTAAAEAAGRFLMTVSKQGLQKVYSPFTTAAQAIIMDPIKQLEQARAQALKAGNGNLAEGAGTEARQIWDRAKQNWKTKGPDASVLGAASDVMNESGLAAVPLVGPTVKAVANSLDAGAEAPGGEDLARMAGTAAGAGTMALIAPALEGVAGVLPEGTRALEGLDAGEQGAALAEQNAADTAANHDALLQKNREQFQNQLELGLQQAEDDRTAATSQAKANNTQAGNDLNESKQQHADLVETNRAAQQDHIASTLERAKEQYGQQFQEALQTQAASATPLEDAATKVNEGLNQYEKKAHTDFEEGINGENGIVPQLEGETTPAAGSPFAERAKARLQKPDPDDHAYTKDVSDLAGTNIDAKLKQKLEDWAEGVQTVEKAGPADEAGKSTTVKVKQPVGDFTADQLIKMRQGLRKAAEGYQRGDVNRAVYGDLIKGVDETLEKLAGQADNPEVLEHYESLRQNYKTAMRNLDSSVADKLRLDSPDKALSDVNKYLMQGNNAPAKIRTMSNILGADTMQSLRSNYLNQLAEMGAEAAQKTLAKIPDATRQEFFGPELDAKLQAQQSLYEKSVAQAEQAAKEQAQYVNQAAEESLGRNASQVKYDKQAQSAAHQQELQTIQQNYNAAKKAATDLSKQQNAPFNTDFAKSISNGTIGDKLAKQEVATSDVEALKSALPASDFEAIQKGIWNRALKDATTGGHFNAAKFLDWYNKIDPNVAATMFSGGDPAALQSTLAAMKDTVSIQRLARAGVVAVGGATGVGVTLAAPHTLLGSLLEFAAGAGASAATRTSLVNNLIDRIAANPALIKAMAKPVSVAAGAKNGLTAAATAAKALPAVAPGMGDRVRVNGQTGTVLGPHPDSGKPFVEWDK